MLYKRSYTSRSRNFKQCNSFFTTITDGDDASFQPRVATVAEAVDWTDVQFVGADAQNGGAFEGIVTGN